MEDLFHLRGVLTLLVLFAATIALPAVLLAYYGLAGVRAEQAAGAADIRRRADAAIAAVRRDTDARLGAFESAARARIASSGSLAADLRELSPGLRAVFRFDEEGDLTGPFVRPRTQPAPAATFRLFAPLAAARAAPPARAAFLYGEAAREAADPATRAWALYQRAGALAAAGRGAEAEGAYRRVETEFPTVRDPWGFRLGDLARLRSGELLLGRDTLAGEAALQRLIDGLLVERWSVGYGGEAAVARRAAELVAGRGNAAWLDAARRQIDARSEQLAWSERLLPELDTLGARGGLFRSRDDAFTWQRTAHALWASTWAVDGQVVFALDLDTELTALENLAERVTSTDAELAAVWLGPDAEVPADAVRTESASSRVPGWRIAVVPRDADAFATARTQERLRGSGIVVLSIGMIAVGAFASARLVQRELDLARDKADFAAHVSHELRSPITQIRLKGEALQLGLATSPEQTTRYYDAIVRESERLSRLVDNMLDFAAIERGAKTYTLRPGDLGGTVRRTVESARVAMETRGMRIELTLPDDLPPVWHDVDAVSQVMTNLLSNAAKYGQEAEWIGVGIDTDGDAVRVSVADRGIGIAETEQPHVFEQYWRSSDPQARRKKGTGIGLTIVKYVMEAHGGRVTLQSAHGRGTTFFLHFPTRAPAGEASSRTS